jgi:hypothetical protein
MYLIAFVGTIGVVVGTVLKWLMEFFSNKK